MNEENFESQSAAEILKEPIKRQVAYKLRISTVQKSFIHENKPILELNDKQIFRVNIIANVIDKFVSEGERKFASITIDDGSAQIRVKAFGDNIVKFESVKIGDTALVIGTLRYFNNELYILADIVKKLDEKWLLARKLEIAAKEERKGEKDQKIVEQITGRKIEEIKIEEKTQLKEKIVEMLKEKEEGIDVEELVMNLKANIQEINNIISELLDEARIYEPKPGFIRLL